MSFGKCNMTSNEILSSIQNYEKQLTGIDLKLLEYLEKRKIVKRIIKRLKKKNNIEINKTVREKEIYFYNLNKSTKHFNLEKISNIYNSVINNT